MFTGFLSVTKVVNFEFCLARAEASGRHCPARSWNPEGCYHQRYTLTTFLKAVVIKGTLSHVF
jgi:hypothetical protein